NPFTIPPEVDIFLIRDKERKKAKAERERMKTMKIHEKITYSTKIKAKQKGCRKALQMEEEEEARKQATNEERQKTLQESLSWKKITEKDNLLEKETFHDYINDRRQIFLLEYAMTVKRDEIQRMENIAKGEEEKLTKAEHCLEKDATMFADYMKESHKTSVQAMKIAEKESTEKTKIVTNIKTITSQIENIQSDISRFKNTLEKYKMFRDFLHQLSPKEWQEEHGKKRTRDLKTALRTTEERESPPTPAEQGKCQGRTVSLGQSMCSKNPILFSRTGYNSQSPWRQEHCKCFPFQEPELYFTDPQQLLTVFMEMEEENLSLILKSQETGESLEKVQRTFMTTYESTMESRTRVTCVRDALSKITFFLIWTRERELAELKQQVATLKSSIAKEEERVADLKLKVHHFSSGEREDDDQDKMLASLNKKVLEVYCHCTGETETNLQTMQMLMVIEKQINDLLDILEKIPPAKLEQAVKAKKMEQRMR
ncbi:CP100 protein, partial [Turnix velox]|nr:CP100 protein [Turnix velox]